ncbi:hypothetical protein SPHV1_410044 [Novosphingobium sp. KN65.2]|nr:hypothetical protein SPHV1_410044 [Novosphingobium sp. KN65.2]
MAGAHAVKQSGRVPSPSSGRRSCPAAAALNVGQEVEIRKEGGRLIIKPVLKPDYTLEELLAGMKPETFHEIFAPSPQHSAERAFGIKADTLLRMQSAYDLAGVRALKVERIAVEA